MCHMVLISGYYCISISKATLYFIVVAASEIIQPRLFIVNIATIPEGLHSAQGVSHAASLVDGMAPSIIHIVDNGSAITV